jgi:plasmid stabilization system protein ParE
MIQHVYWTPEALRTFRENLDYLSVEWDANVVNAFVERVDETVKRIKLNPQLYQVYDATERIHRCVLNERIALFYRIVDNHTIDLLTFWNTSRDPENLAI